jgi:hypothetical protein
MSGIGEAKVAKSIRLQQQGELVHVADGRNAPARDTHHA